MSARDNPSSIEPLAARHGVAAADLLDLLEHRRFAVEYQPILRTDDLGLHGWEALARFATSAGRSLPPDRVFAALHASPLALLFVEHAMKRLQIERAPAAGKLFLNLDPDSWAAGGAEVLMPLFHAARARVVVESIENMTSLDLALSHEMAEVLTRGEIPVALDDVGAEGALFSYSALAGASYLKLDRSWLTGDAPERGHKERLVRALIDTAHGMGAATILEGIETDVDLAAARALGVDHVQGFLFAADFIRAT